MSGRATRSISARLARLEAAAARLPKSPQFVPTEQVNLFRLLCEEYAKPAMIIPSARALLGAFAACCACFPESRQADLADPAVVGRLPRLRQELRAFLDAHWEKDGRYWRQSMAWTDLALAGFAVPVGARDREPAQQWCAGLSELEVLFEAADCLVNADGRLRRWRAWLHLRGSGLEVWESARLPAEEEAVLLAELDAQGPTIACLQPLAAERGSA